MDKYIDKLFDLIKGKSMTDVIMLLSFVYMMYTSIIKEKYDRLLKEEDLEIRQQELIQNENQINATKGQTKAIENQNRIFETIEKKNESFRIKVIEYNDKQLDLLIENNLLLKQKKN